MTRDDLRAKAKAATPKRDQHLRSIAKESDRIRFDRCVEADTYSTLAFIRPDVFLGILDERDALRARAEAAEALVKALPPDLALENIRLGAENIRLRADMGLDLAGYSDALAERDELRAEVERLTHKLADLETAQCAEDMRDASDAEVHELRAEIEQRAKAHGASVEALNGIRKRLEAEVERLRAILALQSVCLRSSKEMSRTWRDQQALIIEEALEESRPPTPQHDQQE
jgi:hypothetical protein